MRALLLEKLYEWSLIPYQRFFKKEQKAWDIPLSRLLKYPVQSLGYHLGAFLLQHDFTSQPKLESHDVYHVLTRTGITVPEEVSMQFYLAGNGKRGLYTYGVLLLGGLLYMDKWSAFAKAYIQGKKSLRFHDLDFSQVLHTPIDQLKVKYIIHPNINL